jgi:hypothetical protein
LAQDRAIGESVDQELFIGFLVGALVSALALDGTGEPITVDLSGQTAEEVDADMSACFADHPLDSCALHSDGDRMRASVLPAHAAQDVHVSASLPRIDPACQSDGYEMPGKGPTGSNPR